MNLYVGLGLALAIILALGFGYWMIRRHGRQAAEGDQAKAGLDLTRRQAEVRQPLPGESEDALRKGEF